LFAENFRRKVFDRTVAVQPRKSVRSRGC
jgi:hypothetical protein